MTIRTPLFIIFFLCSLLSISAQELPYLSEIAVPDSIAVKSYPVLRTEFFALFEEDMTSVDSLVLELKGKELIKRAARSENKSDVVKFYLVLAELRNNDFDLFDYILNFTEENNLLVLYETALLSKAISYYYNDQIDMSLQLAEEAYKYSEESGNLSNKWTLKNFIGVLQINYGNVSRGISNLKEVESIYTTGKVKNIHIYNSDSQNKNILASVRYSIASSYFDIDSLDAASDYIEKVKIYADTDNG